MMVRITMGVVISIALTAMLASSNGYSAQSLNPVAIKEWPVHFGGRPRDPFASSSDAVWFVGQGGNYLARLTPSTGEFFKRELPGSPGPHNLVVAKDGIVWYAGNREGYIGRYDPESDAIEKIEMPDSDAYDPHTLVFDQAQQHIWFTVQGGNFVGRVNLSTRQVDLIKVPTANARPYGIRIAPDGTCWIVLVGTNKLASVDAQTLQLTEYVIPAAGARPRRVEITSDGRVWYADYRRGHLGVYNPVSKQFGEWQLPSGSSSNPYGMASDDEDRIWLVETGTHPNQLVGFDTRTEKVISITPIPSGAGSVRHMDFHAASGNIWFGTDSSTIGRASVK